MRVRTEGALRQTPIHPDVLEVPRTRRPAAIRRKGVFGIIAGMDGLVMANFGRFALFMTRQHEFCHISRVIETFWVSWKRLDSRAAWAPWWISG
ncbi:hypothetical protein TPY_1243 [Sulfobacillus acidophilus TPY]|nr:hypothetical protein TPY_1243 [Sulfobacillus acidophilus TPY]